MNPIRTLARPLLASVFVSGGIDMLRNAPTLAPVAEPVTSKVVDAAQPAVDKAAEAAGPAIETAAEKVVDLAEQAAEALPDAAQPVVDLADQAADAARPLSGSGSGSADDALLAGSKATSSAPPRVELPADPELLTKVNGGVMVGAGLLLAIGKLPRLSAAALAATIIPTTLAGHRFWEVEDDRERAAQQMHFMKNVGLLGGLALAAIDTEGRPGVAWRAKHAGKTARREAKLARHTASAEAHRRLADARSSLADALPG